MKRAGTKRGAAMRANRLKEIWAAGKPAINGWCSMPGAFSAELVANMGWDSVTIDTQHGVIGYAEMLAMLQAVSTTAVTPLVRVSWNAPGEIMRALDAGAYGVICPMINDAAECAAFVQACRYPPAGFRSSGPTRAAIYGGADYHAKANDIVVAFGMIETVEAMENLDQILSVKGLDAVYVGPSDLSISHGYPPGGDKPDEWMMAALKKVVDACKRHKVQPGLHCGAGSYAKKAIEMGFTFVTVGGDNRFMTLGGQAAVAEMKDAPKPGSSGSVY
jgi:4-hydroxy-2-oxoheptanedioate aldolase